MAESKIVEAREAFSVQIDGVPIPVNPGDLWYSDDPVVQGRDHLFRELSVRRSQPARATADSPPDTQAVETADAAPGSARTSTRPAPRRGGTAGKGGASDA